MSVIGWDIMPSREYMLGELKSLYATKLIGVTPHGYFEDDKELSPVFGPVRIQRERYELLLKLQQCELNAPNCLEGIKSINRRLSEPEKMLLAELDDFGLTVFTEMVERGCLPDKDYYGILIYRNGKQLACEGYFECEEQANRRFYEIAHTVDGVEFDFIWDELEKDDLDILYSIFEKDIWDGWLFKGNL